jgi:hypothetical protein
MTSNVFGYALKYFANFYDQSSDASPSPALQSECDFPGISLCRIRSGAQLRSVRFVAARPDKKLASASASPASSIEHPREGEISSADGLLFWDASRKSKTWRFKTKTPAPCSKNTSFSAWHVGQGTLEKPLKSRAPNKVITHLEQKVCPHCGRNRGARFQFGVVKGSKQILQANKSLTTSFRNTASF